MGESEGEKGGRRELVNICSEAIGCLGKVVFRSKIPQHLLHLLRCREDGSVRFFQVRLGENLVNF